MATISRQEVSRTISPLSLLYSVMAGPVIWFAHFLLVWAVAEMGCRINFLNMELISPASIRVFVTVATIIAILAVAVGGFMAYRGWRRLDTHSFEDAQSMDVQSMNPGVEDRLRFLLVLALLFSGLFLFSLIFTAAPTYFVDICDLST